MVNGSHFSLCVTVLLQKILIQLAFLLFMLYSASSSSNNINTQVGVCFKSHLLLHFKLCMLQTLSYCFLHPCVWFKTLKYVSSLFISYKNSIFYHIFALHVAILFGKQEIFLCKKFCLLQVFFMLVCELVYLF